MIQAEKSYSGIDTIGNLIFLSLKLWVCPRGRHQKLTSEVLIDDVNVSHIRQTTPNIDRYLIGEKWHHQHICMAVVGIYQLDCTPYVKTWEWAGIFLLSFYRRIHDPPSCSRRRTYKKRGWEDHRFPNRPLIGSHERWRHISGKGWSTIHLTQNPYFLVLMLFAFSWL